MYLLSELDIIRERQCNVKKILKVIISHYQNCQKYDNSIAIFSLHLAISNDHVFASVESKFKISRLQLIIHICFLFATLVLFLLRVNYMTILLK